MTESLSAFADEVTRVSTEGWLSGQATVTDVERWVNFFLFETDGDLSDYCSDFWDYTLAMYHLAMVCIEQKQCGEPTAILQHALLHQLEQVPSSSHCHETGSCILAHAVCPPEKSVFCRHSRQTERPTHQTTREG